MAVHVNFSGYVWTEVLGIILCAVAMLCLYAQSRDLQTNRKIYREYLLIIALIIAEIFSDCVAYTLGNRPGVWVRHVMQLVLFAEFLLDVLIQWGFLNHLVGLFDNKRISALSHRVAGSMVLLTLVMLIINLFTGWFFDVTADNRYIRGSAYVLINLPAAVNQLWLCYVVFYRVRKKPQDTRFYCWCAAFLPILAMVVLIFVTGYPVVPLAMMMIALVMFAYAQRIAARQLIQTELELNRQNQKLLVAQLQPHFLYNSLMAIMGIEGNPPETVKAIGHFSRLLRGNLHAMEGVERVPADMALSHVRAYAELQQLRFGDRLQVELDLQSTDFYMPPYVVESLIDNAITHGFGGMQQPGTLKVSAKRLDEWYMVTVEDNGCGFDPDASELAESRQGGIQDIRRLVETMCDGRLVIRSAPGQGTRASIMIPVSKGGEVAI